MQLNAKSESLLKKLHPDLARVVRRAATLMPNDLGFIVTCTLRTLDEQKKLVAAGASKTMRSRHLPGKTNGLSHAVDLAATIDGKVKWDWPLYAKLATIMAAAAKAEKVTVEWGGGWARFKDGPHFQLPWAKYPG